MMGITIINNDDIPSYLVLSQNTACFIIDLASVTDLEELLDILCGTHSIKVGLNLNRELPLLMKQYERTIYGSCYDLTNYYNIISEDPPSIGNICDFCDISLRLPEFDHKFIDFDENVIKFGIIKGKISLLAAKKLLSLPFCIDDNDLYKCVFIDEYLIMQHDLVTSGRVVFKEYAEKEGFICVCLCDISITVALAQKRTIAKTHAFEKMIFLLL